MQRLRFFPVYSFSSLFIISFLVHLFLVIFSGVLFEFSKILDQKPQTYRFVSVDLETDKIQKNKKDKKLLSNIDREEKGFFFKDKKIQIQKYNKKRENHFSSTLNEVLLKEIKRKNLDFQVNNKENIPEKKRKNFKSSSSTIHNKSKSSGNVLNFVDNSKNEKRKLTSNKKIFRVDKIAIKKKQDSNRKTQRIFKSSNQKLKNEEDRLKLFRIDQKKNKTFAVSQMIIDKVASADFESKKKIRDDEPISLSTSKTEYFRYFKHIKEKIEESWAWWAPEARGLNGELKLEFTLQRDGRLKKIHLLKSSGHAVLDDEAISAVTRASFSFRSFPLKLKRKNLKIQGTFEYVAERFFVRKFSRN